MEIARVYWDDKNKKVAVLISPTHVREVLEQICKACDSVYIDNSATVPLVVGKATGGAVKALQGAGAVQAPQQVASTTPKGGESDASPAVIADPETGAGAQDARVSTPPRPSSRSKLFGGI